MVKSLKHLRSMRDVEVAVVDHVEKRLGELAFELQ